MRWRALLFFMVLVTMLSETTMGVASNDLRLAFVRGGDLWVLTDRKERRLTNEGGVIDPRLSQDGRFVSYRQGRAYMVTSIDGGGPWRVPVGPNRWSPRENTPAVTDGRSVFTVTVTERGPGGPHLVASGWTGNAWSPDGRWLAVGRRKPSKRAMFRGTAYVGVVASRGGPVVTLLSDRYPLETESGDLGGAAPTAWSSDGQWLLLVRGGLTASAAADDNQFAVVSIRGGRVYPLGVSPNVDWAKWAPRGNHITFVDGGGRFAWLNKKLELAEPSWQQQTRTITPVGYADRDPAWSPDGRAIAFTRSLTQEPPGRDLPAPGQAVYQLDLPDKRPRLVTGSEGGFCPF